MENTRIFKDRTELPLHTINYSDKFFTLIEKLNENFINIKEYQGGRQGLPGLPGLPGCSSVPDFINEDLDDNEQIITTNEVNGLCLSFDSNNETAIKNDLEIMFNKFAHRPLILSNLSSVDNAFTFRQFDEPDLTTPSVTDSNFDFKLSIYNSDKLGNGNHLNLVNSKAIIENRQFGCKSGFKFSVDKKDITSNTETLLIAGNKNSNIENHRHIISLENNYTSISRNEESQKLKLDSGTDDKSIFSGRLQLQTQNSDNVFRIPDRTGFVGIWEDTLNSDEFWEYISYTDMKLSRINYSLNSVSNQLIKTSDFPVEITDKSIVRFKRLNNWVLIEYQIHLKTLPSFSITIELNNLQINMDIPTIGCRTLTWNPGVHYNNPSCDVEDDFNTNYFKITNVTLTNTNSTTNKSFGIILKTNPQLILTQTSPNNTFYFDGQVWASVEEDGKSCETLIIVNDDTCQNLKIN